MGPIEGMWLALVFVFILLGVIRGFLKELGLTTVMIVWLFGMDQIIPRVEDYIRSEGNFLEGIGITEANMGTWLWLLFTLITLVVVYVAYQGETLAFEGQPPKGVQGVLLGALIGAINGYLVTGTLWWLLNRYNYPIRATGMFIDFSAAMPLTPAAERIVNELRLLPPDLLGQGADTATSLGVLPLLVVTMVLLRVIR
ncbi:MAG TPA: hypothetical protein VJG32_22830 [Anaerolineae bacterium]|nr:hypothetical protein [Anaerolineae bacterium]